MFKAGHQGTGPGEAAGPKIDLCWNHAGGYVADVIEQETHHKLGRRTEKDLKLDLTRHLVWLDRTGRRPDI